MFVVLTLALYALLMTRSKKTGPSQAAMSIITVPD